MAVDATRREEESMRATEWSLQSVELAMNVCWFVARHHGRCRIHHHTTVNINTTTAGCHTPLPSDWRVGIVDGAIIVANH